MNRLLFSVVVLLCASFVAADKPPFFLGTATAAYQVEGAWNVSGKGLSWWDVFTHIPGKVAGNQTGDVADDFYHRFREDIAMMKQMGLQYFRMSISWARVLPTGHATPINPSGIEFYHQVFDALLEAGIEPLVTLYHWDLPQQLNLEYNGWISPQVVNDYRDYATLMFAEYGTKVKYWLTFNEPLVFCPSGYSGSGFPPARCSDRSQCPEGNSTTEPLMCAHNVLLSHAAAVQVLRTQFANTGGQIGITLNADWAEPLTFTPDDVEAAERHMLFAVGWWSDPVHFGDYPAIMRERMGDLLPAFTPEQQALLKGSTDFFGVNHYTTSYFSNNPNPAPGDFEGTIATRERDGVPIGPVGESGWLYVVPYGIRRLMNWINGRYHPPAIIITENGFDVPNENEIPLPQVLNDTQRISFYADYLGEVLDAVVQDEVPVIGYFAWSLLDNFEWTDGYSHRFGITYVDYANGLTRYPKMSASWLCDFFQLNATLPSLPELPAHLKRSD